MATWNYDRTGSKRDPNQDPNAPENEAYNQFGGGQESDAGGGNVGGTSSGNTQPSFSSAGQPGGQQTPVNADGSIASSYSAPVASYYGPEFERGQRGTEAIGAARSAKGDYGVNDAYEMISRAYRDQLGREASSDEIWSQIRGQGWKPGDRWVGSRGLNAVIASIGNSPEANNRRNQPQGDQGPGPQDVIQPEPGWEPTGGGGGSEPPSSEGGDGGAPPPTTGGGGPGGGTGGDGWDLDKFASKFGKYNPMTFNQFEGSNYGQGQQEGVAALRQALQNSEWSPGRVAAMKELQKEQALAVQDQLSKQLGGRYASMGRGQGGGKQSALRQLGSDTGADILGAYRDVEERAATGRRDELLRTAGALGQEARAGFGAGLEGQTAQADENFRAWESQMTPYQLALQKALGEQGINVDWGRIGESGRQFNLGHELALKEFDEKKRQFNAGLGFDYTKLNTSMIPF
jgi:hypothetical protein